MGNRRAISAGSPTARGPGLFSSTHTRTAAVALLTAGFAAWQPASADRLVGNTAEDARSGFHNRPIARRFRTGGDSGGYAFTGITLEVAGTGSNLQTGQTFVELWSSNDASGDHKRPQNRLLNAVAQGFFRSLVHSPWVRRTRFHGGDALAYPILLGGQSGSENQRDVRM